MQLCLSVLSILINSTNYVYDRFYNGRQLAMSVSERNALKKAKLD